MHNSVLAWFTFIFLYHGVFFQPRQMLESSWPGSDQVWETLDPAVISPGCHWWILQGGRMGAHPTQISRCQPRCTRAQHEAGPSFPPESRGRDASSPDLTHHAPPWRKAEWNLKDWQLNPNWAKPLKPRKPVRLLDIEQTCAWQWGGGLREGRIGKQMQGVVYSMDK